MLRENDDRPLVVAYDGSEESQSAIHEAIGLFSGRKLVVVTVWEPGLSMVIASLPGVPGSPPSSQAIAEVERGGRAETDRTAHAGATLARELGADAEAVAIADSDDIATSIAAQADHRGACAVVVGSRGLGQVKARLLGSTSQGVIKRAHQPVLVVRPPAGSD